MSAPSRKRYQQSAKLYQRARRVLAGGVSSQFRAYGYPHPLFYTRGEGPWLWDADGNRYLDFTLSQGPLILGHSPPELLARVAQATAQGQIYAGQHEAELKLAERIVQLVPGAELLRFSLSGSEAVHAAIRLARGWTGRPLVAKFEGHYHGWFDNVAWSITTPDAEAAGPQEAPRPVPWSRGVPDEEASRLLILPWNQPQIVENLLRRHGEQLAAVICEPVMCNNGCIVPEPGFLALLRRLCDELRAVLIFDEVITGFRIDLGGAQRYYDVTPDLAVFGKALANGFPISALVGKAEVMEPLARGQVIHAGTMNSGVPSVAAALATLDQLEQRQVHARLFELGRQLMDQLADASRRAGHPLLLQGPGPMFHAGFTPLERVRHYRDTLQYDTAKYARFVAGMHDRGVRLIGRGIWYLSAAHEPEHIEQAARTAYEVLRAL